MKQKPFKMVRFGIKTKDGIVLVGHEAKPIDWRTRKDAKKFATREGDKVVKIVIIENSILNELEQIVKGKRKCLTI